MNTTSNEKPMHHTSSVSDAQSQANKIRLVMKQTEELIVAKGLIAAVEFYQEQTGLPLDAAKQAVENIQQGLIKQGLIVGNIKEPQAVPQVTMNQTLKYLLWAVIASFVVVVGGAVLETWSNVSKSLDTTEGEFSGLFKMVPQEQLGNPSLEGTYSTGGSTLALLSNGSQYMLVFTAASDLSAIAVPSNSNSSKAIINGKTVYWDSAVLYHVGGRQSRYTGFILTGQRDAYGRSIYRKDNFTDHYQLEVKKIVP